MALKESHESSFEQDSVYQRITIKNIVDEQNNNNNQNHNHK